MNERSNLSGLRQRMWRAQFLFAVPTMVLFFLYFFLVGDLSASEWSSLLACVGVGSVVSTGIILGIESYRTPRMIEFARNWSGGAAVSRDLRRFAFRASMTYPYTYTGSCIAAWLVSFVAIGVGMWLQGHESWLLGPRFELLFTYSVGGFGVACVFAYFIGQYAVEPLRMAAAEALPDPAERRELTSRVGLGTKLLAIMGCTALSLVVFSMGIAWQLQTQAIRAEAGEWNGYALQMLASEFRGDEPLGVVGPSTVISSGLPMPSLQPHLVEFSLVDRAGLEARLGFSADLLAELEGAVAGQRHHVRDPRRDDLLELRALPEGRWLVARSEAAALFAPYRQQQTLLAMALLTSFALCGWAAQLFAREVKGSLAAICRGADEIANGNLRPVPLPQCEDEMGELTQAFERMRTSLRETVARVVETADRVESASGEIYGVAADVAFANEVQGVQIGELDALMASIGYKAAGASELSSKLGEVVEDSSSSIIELGAAGDQLNSTASVLNGRVEEVSDSIEQMVRSVRLVSESTGDLASAAADTSSSMEEMASAMKAVDVTAAKTADLSNHMLEAAESGRSRVRETIDGMDAIREATDAAEGVIRGLGERTEQIGAILDVIDDVGDETSLLALNAAIIAAQAGDQGRAFSVVADEIKELADRVLASTKEIATVIRSVQDEAAAAVGAIEAGSTQVARGVDLSAEAGLSLEEITRAANESGDRIQEIVRAVREQTKAASHVAALMDRVRTGVEDIRTAGTTQDRANDVVFQSSETMREVAQQVRRTTEEQAGGFVRIRGSVETVRDTVDEMASGLREQEEACSAVSSALAQVREGTASNEASAERMRESTRTLREQAEALREGVAKFQI